MGRADPVLEGVDVISGFRLKTLPTIVAAVCVAVVAGSAAQVAVPATATTPSASPTPTTRTGYIAMADGVRLKYTLKLPAGDGPFPVVVTGDGYDSGVTGGSSVVGSADELVEHGYAALGYNVRGTGCSTGTFEMFPRRWNADGAAVIEWAARQRWSTGRTALLGHSFAGFNAWGIAAERPPHLTAMAVAVTTGDFYRDAFYPGGIHNVLLAAGFSAAQQALALTGVLTATAGGDLACAANYATSGALATPNTVAVTSLTHPDNDAYWKANAREQYFDDVDVPILVSASWQDGIAGSGIFGRQLTRVRNPDKVWFVGSNGDHDLFDVELSTLFRYFDHHLKGASNGWQGEPHIRLWQDSSLPSGGDRVSPGWEVDVASWPLPVRSHELFLRAGHALSDTPPAGAEPADPYAYPRLAASALTANNSLDQVTWTLPFDTAGAEVYTTAQLTHDVVVAGPASLDFWLSSTATDTDVQATLTEVRPDGQEVYLQRGWLRMSARATDAALSTPLEPVPTGARGDARPLVPGDPTFARLRIFPFSHTLRAGSRLRVIIDAPTMPTGIRGFTFNPTVATNRVFHDATHPSVLRLGVLAGESAAQPLPACGHSEGEPCRPDAFSDLPSGTTPVFVGTDLP